MLTITLPDESQKQFDTPVTVHQVAESIGPGLAKAALAGRVDGTLVDTSHTIDEDSESAIVTAKDDDGVEVLRHYCAHLMAQAVQQLFPTAQVTIGPTVEDGFYYDFAYERPFTPEEAPGMVFWHPKGWTVWQVIKQYIRSVQQANGYLEINTPQVVDMSLWEKSGHVDKFGDDMFSVQADNHLYAIKPMNCPCHVQVFNQGLKSYRELTMRLAEFGSCHRDVPSGTLQGTMLATQSYLQISQNRALMVPILKRGLTCLHRTSCTSTMPTGLSFRIFAFRTR